METLGKHHAQKFPKSFPNVSMFLPSESPDYVRCAHRYWVLVCVVVDDKLCAILCNRRYYL